MTAFTRNRIRSLRMGYRVVVSLCSSRLAGHIYHCRQNGLENPIYEKTEHLSSYDNSAYSKVTYRDHNSQVIPALVGIWLGNLAKLGQPHHRNETDRSFSKAIVED